MSEREPLAASMVNIAKSYGSVPVLMDVSVAVRPGTVHALLGENGAGKSTLVKILAGALSPDRGTVEIGGNRLRPSPRSAHRLGVRCIHQNRMLASNLSVADNISMSRGGLFRRRAGDSERASEALLRLGVVDIDIETPTGSLAAGEQQLVEIARELADDARFVIMDEPTAALSTVEARRLLDTVRRLRLLGTAVLLVSHDLADVMDIADEVTVIRDGRVALQQPISAVDPVALAKAMLGQEVAAAQSQGVTYVGQADRQLSMQNVSGAVLSDFDLTVNAGEVVGVTGILGSGIDEVARVAAGAQRPIAGGVTFGNSGATSRRRGKFKRSIVGYVPGDRSREGIFEQISARQQMDLTRANLARTALTVSPRRELGRAKATAATVALDERYLDLPGRALSGGNQQKVVLARALQAAPRVLVVHDPTRGVDVGARAAIHRRILALADEGCAVLLVSSDMSEIAALSSQVVVLRRGIAAYRGESKSPSDLMDIATGGSQA